MSDIKETYTSHIDFINDLIKKIKENKSTWIELDILVEGKEVELEVKGYFVEYFKVDGIEYVTYEQLTRQEMKHEFSRYFILEFLD